MKIIKVNETEYVEKKYYEKLDKEIKSLKKIIKNKPRFKEISYCGQGRVPIGMGSSRLNGEWASCTFSISYLQTAINMFRELRRDNVTFYFGENHPLIMGDYNKKTKMVAGIMIAPIKISDE